MKRRSTENMEYAMKLLDKQRLVAKYDVDNFINKHIVLYAKHYLGVSCTRQPPISGNG